MSSNPHRIVERRYERKRRPLSSRHRTSRFFSNRRNYSNYTSSNVGHNITDTICGAIAGTCCGIVLIIGATFLLFFTERQYIDTYKDIKYIQNNVVAVPSQSTIANYNSLSTTLDKVSKNTHSDSYIHEFDFKEKQVASPLYLQGYLNLDTQNNNNNNNNNNANDAVYVRDESMGIFWDCMVLSREMEMYQWVETTEEHKREVGRQPGQRSDDVTYEIETVYNYNKKWTSKYYDSNKFKYTDQHYNPYKSIFADNTRAGGGETRFYTNLPIIVELNSGYQGDNISNNNNNNNNNNDDAEIFVSQSMFKDKIVNGAANGQWRRINSDVKFWNFSFFFLVFCYCVVVL